MKRLYKSRKDKVVDGVCAGIAHYFEVDPVLVRVVFVLFTVFGGMGVVAYIIGMIVMPREPYVEENKKSSEYSSPRQEEPIYEQPQEYVSERTEPVPSANVDKSSLLIGVVLVAVGAIFLVDNFSIFHNFRPWYWFTRHFWDFLVPGLLIVAGIAMLKKGSSK